jgi:hypothetical protein
MSRYQKTESFGPFKETRFAVKGPDREKLGQRIDAIEKRFQSIANRKPASASTTQSTRTTTSTRSGVLGKATPKASANPAKAELMAEMRRRNYSKTQMQRALKAAGY